MRHLRAFTTNQIINTTTAYTSPGFIFKSLPGKSYLIKQMREIPRAEMRTTRCREICPLPKITQPIGDREAEPSLLNPCPRSSPWHSASSELQVGPEGNLVPRKNDSYPCFTL